MPADIEANAAVRLWSNPAVPKRLVGFRTFPEGGHAGDEDRQRQLDA
jgi:hypothetical protein